MKSLSCLLSAVAAFACVLSGQSIAEARRTRASAPVQVEEPGATPGDGDGVYGRFFGDLAYRLDLGIEWDLQASALRPLARVEFTGYQTLGLYANFRQSVQASDEVENLLGVGATFSPLFLMRWSGARETGWAYWDLFVDSFTLAPGIVLATPETGRFASAPGFELGLSAGVPILPRANGPWLRTHFNLNTGRRALGFEQGLGSSAMLILEWQGFFFAGLLKTNRM